MNALSPSTPADQAGLPLLDFEAVADICQSPALGAVMAVRFEQLVKFNHSPAADLLEPVDHLPRQALARVHDAVDVLGRGQLAAAPDRRDMVLRKLSIAAALLLAAYDRIAAVPPEPAGVDL